MLSDLRIENKNRKTTFSLMGSPFILPENFLNVLISDVLYIVIIMMEQLSWWFKHN